MSWTTPTGRRVGSVISVDNVTAVDAGDYRCEVTSEGRAANDSITIRGEGFTAGAGVVQWRGYRVVDMLVYIRYI